MLKLICGPAGSGKTTSLIQSIREDIENRVKCFLLVPEQQAYISEKNLPAMLPGNAGLYFEVVHFSGLADDIFREYGGVTHANVNNGIRSLLMWETLRSCAPLLKQYGGNSKGDTTLTALMLQTVTELRTGGIRPDMLESVSDRADLPPVLKNKLSDIALIDAIYHAKLEEAFGEEPADKLQRMARKLRNHSFFADCNVYIDSFTSFTSPEYEVLHEILAQAQSVTVTLGEDTFGSSQLHFESIAETEKRLYKLAAQCNSAIEKTALSSVDSEKPAELRILEKNLWNFALKKEERELPLETERGSVRLLRCSNLYEEAEAAAIHICELVQSGMHYGDIAVIVRDTEVYRGVLDAALERYGIPYFLSERTDLSTKPISRLILSALRAVSRNYRQTDVITLLKTGLCGT
ncbi:MAG: exodeoxyribonuclease V subunit gamma, partial [Clostridia bacterium]|nr:exodeoxyribonuclease V subunit gamma [Clostridia bacterium]